MSDHPRHDPFDEALSRRLAGLSAMPVDTSALDRALAAQLPPPPGRAAPAAPARSWSRTIRPMAAVAASVLVMVTVILAMQGRTVRASADVMAQMHRDIVAGRVPTMKADSIEKANAAFKAFGTDLPTLAQPPEAHAMACCMRNVGAHRVACVLLDSAGTPVTVAVAPADAVDTGPAASVAFHGQSFRVQKSAELTMVTLDRGRTRICLIGALPAERLMGLSGELKF
jgi:hypothetical protein